MQASVTADGQSESALRLRYAAMSPFARKVLVAIHELGLADRIDLVPADVWSPASDILDDNPLGKVPALATPDGVVIGSTLICEYLATLSNRIPLLPSDPGRAWAVRRAHALADGIMEAAVAHVTERLRRPQEVQWQGWLDRQEAKITAGLGALSRLPETAATEPDLLTITLGCLLEYLDIRLPALAWRASHPALATWLADFGSRPAMAKTRPPAPR